MSYCLCVIIWSADIKVFRFCEGQSLFLQEKTKTMRIAFDLDNTLIRSEFDFELETPKYTWLAYLLGIERLRKGTGELIKFCQKQGWEVWIYTTSYRSAWQIRKMFWLYGISLSGIINQTKHNQRIKMRCTKYPPEFGIHLLIDDSEGVKLESEKYSFNMLCINPKDETWTEIVKAHLLTFSK